MTRQCSRCGALQYVALYTDDCLYCQGPLIVPLPLSDEDKSDLELMDSPAIIVGFLVEFWRIYDLFTAGEDRT